MGVGMDISVIIRFKDEARYLRDTFQAVRGQCFPHGEFEICAVDNASTDGSRTIAEAFADQLLDIDTYLPGRALNLAIEKARGRWVAVLSAHTVPADRHWLRRLAAHMEAPRLAAVYGGQLYNLDSRFLDKRDLDIFSTLEPRVERRDSDLWNANSMFPRARWEERRFDESVYELEDHHWAKVMLARGYEVHFEPQALVYHYRHIDRLDREHLASSPLSEPERIREAIAELDDPRADWPRLMVAGMTLSSLTRSPGIREAVPALGRQLTGHEDFDIRWRMAQALGKIAFPESVAPLIRALDDPSFYPRDEAAWSLARLGALAVPALAEAAPRLSPRARPFAALALGASRSAGALPLAVGLLSRDLASPAAQERRDAAYFAGEIASPGAVSLVPALEALLDDSQPELCKVGCWALGCFAAGGAAVDLERIRRLARSHPDPLVRFEARVALGKAARHDAGRLADVLEGCYDDVGRVRYGCVQTLRLRAEEGLRAPRTEGLEEDDDFGVRFESRLLGELLSERRTKARSR